VEEGQGAEIKDEEITVARLIAECHAGEIGGNGVNLENPLQIAQHKLFAQMVGLKYVGLSFHGHNSYCSAATAAAGWGASERSSRWARIWSQMNSKPTAISAAP